MALSNVITIHPSELNPNIVPVSVRDFIPANQWSVICQNLNSVVELSNCYSCGAELGICLLTGFFCIFCCHACIYTMVYQGLADDKIRLLNRSYYGGNHVLGYVNGCLTVNIAVMNSIPTNSPFQPVVVQPVGAIAGKQSEYQATAYPAAAAPVAQPVVAVPVQTQQQRSFYVMVPANAVPGSTTAFTAPTGQLVQVSIPPGAVPGQQLMVYY